MAGQDWMSQVPSSEPKPAKAANWMDAVPTSEPKAASWMDKVPSATPAKCDPGDPDCSRFTQLRFAEQGINIPRTAVQQYRATPPVFAKGQAFDESKLQPGDLVFFDNGHRDSFNTDGKKVDGGYVNHVGIYRGNGFVEHDSAGRGPKTSRLSDMAKSLKIMGASRPGQTSNPGFGSQNEGPQSGDVSKRRLAEFDALLGTPGHAGIEGHLPEEKAPIAVPGGPDTPDDMQAAMMASQNPKIRQMAAQIDAPQEAAATEAFKANSREAVKQLLVRNPMLGGNPIDPKYAITNLPQNKAVVDNIAGFLNPVDQGAFLEGLLTQPVETAKGIGNSMLNVFRATKEDGTPVTYDDRVNGLFAIASVVAAGHGVFKAVKGAMPKMDTVTTPKITPPLEGETMLASGVPIPQLLESSLNKGKGGGKIGTSVGQRIRNLFLENLSGLRENSPEGATLAARVGASRAEAGVLIRKAGPLIDQTVGETGFFGKMRTALVESRLQGIRDRWNGMADDLRNMTDAEFENKFNDDYSDLARSLKIGGDVRSEITNGNVDLAREMLADAMGDASTRVASVMDPAEFAKLTQSPEFKKGLAVYKDHIEAPLNQSHALNEGVFSDSLGPLDTYYPLTPLDEMGNLLQRWQGVRRGLPFSKPKNVRNNFATGLSPSYDVSVSGLVNTLEGAIKSNNKAALVDNLHASGLVQKLTKEGRASLPDAPTIDIGGTTFDASVMEVKSPKTLISNGQTIQMPGQYVLVPNWLAKELHPVLAGGTGFGESLSHKILSGINTFGLAGPLDAAFHTNNLIGSMVTGTPFLDTSILGKTIGNIPLTKRLYGISKIMFSLTEARKGGLRAGFDWASTPDAIRDLQEMAKNGALPSRFATETYSRAFAEQTGAHLNRTSFGATLYGPSGVDIRARLLMYRIAREINPGATGTELAKMTNQLGSYNRALESTIERSVKGSAVAPFFTAGKTMWMNGVRTWLGKTAMPLDGLTPGKKLSLRVAQQLSGGAAGYVGTWVLLHKAATGSWPWEDPRSRFGKIPTGVNDKGEQSYIDLRFFNPIADRGASAVGIDKAYDTYQRGGTGAQVADAGFTGIMNSMSHPFVSGPAFNSIFTGVTGRAPHLQDINSMDLTTVAPDRGGGMAQRKENALQGIAAANSFLGDMARKTGMIDEPYYFKDEGEGLLTSVFNLAFPGLTYKEDIAKKEKNMVRDAKGRYSAAQKQLGITASKKLTHINLPGKR